jgi:hypothetical protein
VGEDDDEDDDDEEEDLLSIICRVCPHTGDVGVVWNVLSDSRICEHI